jgi:hypothetical protein
VEVPNSELSSGKESRWIAALIERPQSLKIVEACRFLETAPADRLHAGNRILIGLLHLDTSITAE